MFPKNATFAFFSSGLLSAVVVAALGLVTNLVDDSKIVYYLAAVAVFVFAAGLVAFALNVSSVSYAEQVLHVLENNCSSTLGVFRSEAEETLRHVRNEYTQSVLRGAIIHDSELAALERSSEVEETWIVTPFDLANDVPGTALFNVLRENMDVRKKRYIVMLRDSARARENARLIASGITNRDMMTFVLLTTEEWSVLPIAGIPVTIHNPNIPEKVRVYIATQDDAGRGKHWAVFHGWMPSEISRADTGNNERRDEQENPRRLLPPVTIKSFQ